MARRYSRREFLTDAGVALAGSVLLKVLAPTSTSTPDHLATPADAAPTATQMPFARPDESVAVDPAHPQCPAPVADADAAQLG